MKNKELEFPDCWEELFPAEWMYLLKLRKKLISKKGIALADIKMEWCRFVLSNRGMRAHGKSDYYLLIYDLAQTLDWMWRANEEDESVEVIYSSTKNLLPEWKNLRGPLSHGSDMTFGEFRNAVTMMNGYNESHEPEMLQALVGILYRRPGKKIGKADFDGKYREDFLQERINFYASRVKCIPEHIQWGIYAWFANFCEYLLTGSFIIDGAAICFSPIFERQKKEDGEVITSSQNIGLNSILFSVAETGIFGDAEDTDNTLLLKVMLKMLDDKQRADAMLTKK
ncbi:hypothetical protein [uncultured Bacteroides sp.]|uniref:hypothetical protein n=1 Tax=uncultured Bacteroides sp. TaxID=162156 RepID=UPI002AA8701D|nr:hypothetical protein [uncultured Bacteroides sp.]